MFELTLEKANPVQAALAERLDQMVLARRIAYETQLAEPVLLHEQKEYKGITAINSYLDEMANFVREWNQCLCDKWCFEAQDQ
ncbi:MAG: hypothetical protein AAFN10_09255 [Bacteroidota bacterium]